MNYTQDNIDQIVSDLNQYILDQGIEVLNQLERGLACAKKNLKELEVIIAYTDFISDYIAVDEGEDSNEDNCISESDFQSLVSRVSRKTGITVRPPGYVSGSTAGGASGSLQYDRYWGRLATTSPTDGDITGLTGAGVGTGHDTSTSRFKSYDSINGAGQYIYFAFPSGFGTPTFIVNNFINNAFTLVDTRIISGTTQVVPYQIWRSNIVYNSPVASFDIT